MALLLLSYASIQSTVMQVAMARPLASAPTVMAQMSMARPAHPGRPAKPVPACPYCAAAAHLPTLHGSTPFQAPSTFIFTAFRVVASHGPRGPPARQPRARGPPPIP